MMTAESTGRLERQRCISLLDLIPILFVSSVLFHYTISDCNFVFSRCFDLS